MKLFPLGVIADDITGACDLAGGVAELGLRTVVTLGVPADSAFAMDADCAVVALKSRTAEPAQATRASRLSAERLLAGGARTLYQKYCSTFDSTDAGNIGPVADALAGLVAAEAGRPAVTIGTPATPHVGRTQYLGHLFVGDRLLSESSLRNHPLTPMRDPDLVRVLSKQTSGAVALVTLQQLRSGRATDAIRQHMADGAAHLLVDAITDDDLGTLAAALGELRDDGAPFVVGGAAGLATALARGFVATAPRTSVTALPPVPHGRRLILSGSSSERTNEQVAAFGGIRIALDPVAAAADPQAAADAIVDRLAESYQNSPAQAVLVSATAPADRVREVQDRLGAQAAAEGIESTLGRIAVAAVERLGVSHLLVAGGETSGAVCAALGVSVLQVGALAAPGVPWTVAESNARTIALLLKSGNFGEPDLFESAWAVRP